MKKIIEDKVLFEHLSKIDLKSKYDINYLTECMMFAYSKNKRFNATNIINKYLNNNNDIFLENVDIQIFANFEKQGAYNIKFKNEKELRKSIVEFLDKYREGNIIQEETITEGIRFFKTSDKIDKLTDKIEAKLNAVPENDREVLKKLVSKMDKVSGEFRKLENDYKNGIDKNIAKVKYKDLTKDYQELLTIVSKDATKKALKTINSTVATLLTLSVPYAFMSKFFPGMMVLSGGFLNLIKRSGMLIALGIPIKFSNSLVNKGLNKYSNDRLLQQEIEKALEKKKNLL